MHLPSLTDDELLRHVDNLPDASELVRELARRFADHDSGNDAIDALDNVGIDVTRTADLETLENALAFHRRHDVYWAEKLIDACADADVHDASDMRALAEKADRVATFDKLRQQIAALIA